MGRLVYRHKEFIVIEDDYRAGEHIIINTRGAYENHCHVKRLKTAKMLVKLMKKKRVPKSNYLRESVKRVTLDERYIEKIDIKIAKDRDKQYYYNVGGRGR